MITLKLFLLLSASIFYFSCKSVTVCIAVFITSNSGWMVVVLLLFSAKTTVIIHAVFQPPPIPRQIHETNHHRPPTLYPQEKPSSYPAAYCCDFVVIPYLFSTSPFDFVCYICYTGLALRLTKKTS